MNEKDNLSRTLEREHLATALNHMESALVALRAANHKYWDKRIENLEGALSILTDSLIARLR